ncbi:hypothetical protein B0H65DRAFT_545028 [Neurospora tetraspora]|uniref:Uncharacterized protein n=1 Tax=Neurospora tetraspora TaxID=94610 RepID=A0AAE0JQF5_9PEZI|nr:hypothetical protein B0H65DRAFT_545028 [Neurospora tetraspora]
MAPNSISKANPNGYKPKGKKPTNFKKHLSLSREEQAAVDEFRTFYSESPKSNERKNDEKSGYTPADYDTPRTKMENPLPAGAKGLSASRWATSPKEESKDRAPFVPQISTTSTSKAKAQYRYSKKFGPTPEEDAADNGESFYQAADHDTPRARMENPLPFGNKGLAGSRWAKKEESKDRAPFVPPISTTSTSKTKAQYRYTKKYGPTPEEDAAVAAFFAESPKKDGKEQKDNAPGESLYQAADHETPRAKMENPLPFGNKGLAGSRWAKKDEFNN